MSVVSELIRQESDGSISFGDYSLAQKSKLDGVKHDGSVYKVKTYQEITKLERDERFVYESVPGTSVEHFQTTEQGVAFAVEGPSDAQITLELDPETEYTVTVGGESAGTMKTNLGGKLNISVELEPGVATAIEVTK